MTKIAKLKEILTAGYFSNPSFEELSEAVDMQADEILALFKDEREAILNIGAVLMAEQIRKSIEEGIGRFSNEDANWILDRLDISRVMVEEKCACEWCHTTIGRKISPHCACLTPDCTGKILRPATWEEIKKGGILKVNAQ